MPTRFRLPLLIVVCLAGGARGGDWPQFRGAARDNISRETGLLRQWPEGGPRVLWTVEVCQGYAAAAIQGGWVYFEDYSRENREWLLRCVSLADGKERWRLADSKNIRPNHGITRATPAVDGRYVFALDPKCVFHCVDAETGRELWRKELVQEYGTQIPEWYNGQNPLIEPDRVVIGVGGTDALMVAFDKATGSELWRTPNPDKWRMAHASVMPAQLGGVKQYVWCTLAGPLGVRADDGVLLWHYPRKFNIAVAPSPLPIGDDRVFMSAGYDAGTIMLRVRRDAERFVAEPLYELTSEQWNTEVHTPIVFQDHLFAVGRKNRGLFTCLNLDGQAVWTSEGKADFDLGSFLLADDMFFVLEGKTGLLRVLEANTKEYRELARAAVLSGDNVWGPMALSDGKLVLRDMTKMVCIEVGRGAAQSRATDARYRLVGDELQVKYRKVGTIGGRGDAPGQFAEELRGIAVDAENRIYAVGDTKVAVFSADGDLLRHWTTQRRGYAVAVVPNGKVYVGEEEQIELFDGNGRLLETWRDPERLGLVTAIGFAGESVIVADTQARCLRRLDGSGRILAAIGKDNRMRGFLVPNRHLDFALDATGEILVVNAGMHRVERYASNGALLGHFGRFDGRDPAGFPGCCNPTNIARLPDGNIVLAEKAGPRVKVVKPDGTLLTVVATDEFDPNCKNMDVAADARGRIYVIDTVRLHIVVFEPSAPTTQEAPL